MLFKYLPPQRIDVLQTCKIRFTSIVSMNDPFESSLKIGQDDYAIEPRLDSKSTQFLSLSRNNENLLMWSHYAESHKGFCIGFKRSHKYFRHAQMVRYRKHRTHLNGVNLHSIDPKNITHQVCLEKAIDWAYEEEERLFYESFHLMESIGLDEYGQDIDLATFPIESVHSIHIGLRADDTLIEELKELIKNLDVDISLYKARMKKHEYAIEFILVN